MKKYFGLVGVFLLLSVPAFAARGGGGGGYRSVFGMEEKQKEKEKTRWNLTDWLETRDRMRLMDLWLHINSPSPYEFYVGGAFKHGSLESGGYYGGWDAFVAGYAYIFGVEFFRRFSEADRTWGGLFNLRMFGVHHQGTNITLQGGIEAMDRAGEILTYPLLGASFTLYLHKVFGLEALYRHSFVPNVTALGDSADRFEVGAFIDFKYTRVFVDYIIRREENRPANSFKAAQVGTRVYF